MTIERTFVMEDVRRIVASPEVYPHVSDDGSVSAEEYQPIENEQIIYLAVGDGAEPLGMFILIPQNAACVEVHTCLTKPLWGRSFDAARLLVDWVWQNTGYARLVTNVPSYNRLAYRLAKKAGMTVFGINHASYLKRGKLYNQVLLGISREAICR